MASRRVDTSTSTSTSNILDWPAWSQRIRLLVPGFFAVTTTCVGLVAVASIATGLLTITRRTRVSRLISTDLPASTCSVCVSGAAACWAAPDAAPVVSTTPSVTTAVVNAFSAGRASAFSGLIGSGSAFREFLFTAFLPLIDLYGVKIFGLGQLLCLRPGRTNSHVRGWGSWRLGRSRRTQIAKAYR